jgi:teichuronic acid biosynthesis glycosyltransferase TuaG
MTAYNAEKTINESVNSVLGQTYTDWELIVVFDGNICEVPNDARIRIIQNERNMGVAYSRNLGVKKAQGEWIAFLDADDVWRKDKLERQLAFIRRHNAQISYTASAFFGSDYVLEAVEELTYRGLLRHNLMSCSSVMVNRELAVKFPFPLRLNTHEDYSKWLRIVHEVGIAYGLNEPLLKYRLSESSKSANRISSALMTYGAYREIGYNVAVAVAMTVRYAMHSITKRQRINRSRS